jgi:hypothetical protein
VIWLLWLQFPCWFFFSFSFSTIIPNTSALQSDSGFLGSYKAASILLPVDLEDVNHPLSSRALLWCNHVLGFVMTILYSDFLHFQHPTPQVHSHWTSWSYSHIMTINVSRTNITTHDLFHALITVVKSYGYNQCSDIPHSYCLTYYIRNTASFTSINT